MRTKRFTAIENRSGVTLIEMLTVVGLMMFLVAIAVPAFNAVNNSDKQIQDAARSLQAYITESRSKAILTGRPCGIAFVPYETYPQTCLRAQLVETPPVFCGYSESDTCTVSGSGSSIQVKFNTSGVEPWCQKGNKIRFAGRGMWYKMTSGNGSSTSVTVSPVNNNLNKLRNENYRPWLSTALSEGNWETTYEIQAAPIAESKNYLQAIGMTAPLKFPRGICADMNHTGVGTSGNSNSAVTSYVIFSPTGQVQEWSSKGSVTETFSATEKIRVLIGTWEKALENTTGNTNADYGSYWVVIDPQTGTVKVEPYGV